MQESKLMHTTGESNPELQYVTVRRGMSTFTHVMIEAPTFQRDSEDSPIKLCHTDIDPETGTSKRCPHGYIAVWQKNGV